MRKKQLKRELAKETRFRPAGQAPIEQGFHCQSNSKAYEHVLCRCLEMLSSPNMRRVQLHQILIADARVEFSTMDCIISRAGQRHRRQETQKDLSKDSAV